MTAKPQDDLTKAAEMIQNLAGPVLAGATFLIPHIINLSRKGYKVYEKLPHDYLQLLTGVVFCLAGGFYPALFAAVEAARIGGFDTLVNACSALSSEALTIIEASKKDDKIDKDGDGIADVNQIAGNDLIIRKTELILSKMNPEKVNEAISALYKVWLSVLAVLVVQFARVVTMSLTISEFVSKPLNKYVTPAILPAFPKEYHRWVPVVLNWIVKAFAMSIAWYIQTVVSALSSAMRGGLLVSRSLLKLANKNGWKFIPANHEETNIDEFLAYGMAALGFLFQFSMNFAVPFPFNILLFPFELAEMFLKYQVASSK
eukprot:CAMPEP_0197831668 /NCGR_PEP_ID=MMETSP1437-20131217/11465_1 /TAXON_ID=49252 ORGANISM="Eucampia antarctica, Strain CCMP1452" /NCGR_SAMPLE_ID=MMETSP1437 /ASSEMBLY_ACC=CAM_ASM_001096 /LENGTH=315 /DNA_ID=CAMNT_0043434687 /DNA_START=114 /DNA_END=1061 /DNA_ORIENTATION=+